MVVCEEFLYEDRGVLECHGRSLGDRRWAVVDRVANQYYLVTMPGSLDEMGGEPGVVGGGVLVDRVGDLFPWPAVAGREFLEDQRPVRPCCLMSRCPRSLIR